MTQETWILGDHEQEHFKILSEVLRGPLDTLGFDAEEMKEETRDSYIFDMARALLGLATERSRRLRQSARIAPNAANKEGDSDV